MKKIKEEKKNKGKCFLVGDLLKVSTL